jgi:hypothetical protein
MFSGTRWNGLVRHTPSMYDDSADIKKFASAQSEGVTGSGRRSTSSAILKL